MAVKMDALRVVLTSDGFYPRSLQWQGRRIRVLYVEETFTSGLERRYRVRTSEGRCELGLHTGTGVWQMHRAPAWFERLWMRIQDMPRYPAPARRRRGLPVVQARPVLATRAVATLPPQVIPVGR